MAASATCMVKRVGCTRSIPVTVSGADIASVTENPDSRAISGSASATVAANTGSFASSSAPIAAHCEPCPENTHTGPRSSLSDRGRIRSVAVGDLAQRRGQLLGAAGDHRRAHRPVRAPPRQRVGQIRQRHRVCALLRPASQPLRGFRRSPSAELDDNGNNSGPADRGSV